MVSYNFTTPFPTIPVRKTTPSKSFFDAFDQARTESRLDALEQQKLAMAQRQDAEAASLLGELYGGGQGGLSLDALMPSAPAAPPSAHATEHGRDPSLPGMQMKAGIAQAAKSLGIDPVDLATVISYETGGTFDPLKYGPTTKWGRHRGLIQFGEPQARDHGVDWNNPVVSQLGPEGAVVKYLRAAGVKPGMGLLDVYSAINAGAPGRYEASDAAAGGAPGTVRDKVTQQMGGHRKKAMALFGMADAAPAQVADASGGTSGPSGDLMRRMLANPKTRDIAISYAKARLEAQQDARDPAKQLALRKAQLEVAKLENPEPELTSDQREYEMAKQQGFEGSFLDYITAVKRAGATNVNVDTGIKLPSGFRWKDPQNTDAGVEPIPGGPAEQIPAELAARVGLAESFLGQFPDILKGLEDGLATGPVDWAAARAGNGIANQIYRQIESGTDALQRMLTGAGMPQSEADAYARRYLPTWRDDSASAASKLRQLKRELESAKEMAMRGRGADATVPADSGVINYEDWIRGE